MGAVVSSLGSAAASGLTNLVALCLLSWTAAAAIKACEGSLDDEGSGGEWRLVRCVLAAEKGGREGGGEPRTGRAEGLRKWRLPRDGGTAASSSRRPSLDKQSRSGASCRSFPSPSWAGFGGGGGDESDCGRASNPPVALASTVRRRHRNDRGGVDDNADGDRDDADDESVERGGDGGSRDEDDDGEWGGSVWLAAGCAQLGRAAGAQATVSGQPEAGCRRAQLRQSGCERAASSPSGESASCVAGGNCATRPPPTDDDANCARSAARSSPCRVYYCSSSHATNAGDDRASAPQQSRMLSIAPAAAAAAATKSAAASTRMTNNSNNNNNTNNINNSATNITNRNKHTSGSDNISKIRLQINTAANRNSKQAPIENPSQIPHLAMEPIGAGRQRSIVIKSRQTQFAQTKSAASSLDSGHSGGSSGRGSHSDLSLASSNIINNNNNNSNNNNEDGEEEGEDLDEDYTKSSSNMLHPTVSALLQSTANLTLARHHQQPQNHYELVVDVDTPPPSPLKRSKKMQMLHAGDQLSLKHQRTSYNQQQQQQVAQVASHQEHQHQILHETNSSAAAAAASDDARQYRQLTQERQRTQDATYLAKMPGRNHLIELLAAARRDYPQNDTRPPPRPWLSPAQQLQFLSKGRLRQLFQEGRIDRHQYEQLLEFRPSRRCATKSKWIQQQQPTHGTTPATAAATSAITPSDKQQHTTANTCQGPTGNEFTVLSYNVLSDRMVNPSQFPSSPDLALNWLYRSELILRQLLDHDADIVALQELEMEQFESFFRPKLEELGHYSGLFESKSRARTMDSQMRKRVDGCAIFYKRNKFKLIGRHLLEFNQIAMANSHGSEAMLNRVMTRDNIGLVAVLELVDESPESASGDNKQRQPLDDDLDETFLEYSSQMHTSSGSSRTTSTSDSVSSGSTSSAYRTTTSTTTNTTSSTTTTSTLTSRRIIVCNTHIHWDPNYCDVKLIQTIMLMNELKHIARHYRLEANAGAPAGDGATQAARLDESERRQQQPLQQARTPSADDDDDADDDADDLRGESLVPLVLLGDFNSMQKSGVVQFLLNGAIDSSHKDFKDFRYTPCKTTLTLLGRRQRQREAQQQQLQLQRLAGLNQSHLLVSRRASDQAALALSRGPSGGPSGIHSSTRIDTSSSLARRQSSPLTCSSDSSQTSSPLPHSPLVAPPGDANANRCPQGLISYEHPFKLASAYEKGVMPFTNYCTHFKATIDYIFYDNDQLQLLASLGPLDKDWLRRSNLQGFPQMDFPSDHLPLMARFRLLSVEDLDDLDARSSPSQMSSIGLASSAKLTIASSNSNNNNNNNNWRPQQQPVGEKPNAAQVAAAAAATLNQQRNQRKQLLYINQNLRKKPQQQQQLATAAAVAALPRTLIGSDEHAQSTWYRLRRDSPPTAASNQQQEARPESRVRQQGNSNHYHCYFPQHHLKQHIERQLQQNQANQQQQQQQLRMQFIKERVESCNQNKTNTHNDNQDGIKQAAAAANSRRPAKQSSRRQLPRKLKQIRPEKFWPGKPLLVKLKENWS